MSINFDQAEARWRHFGVECAVLPNHFGCLNGYVRIPRPLRWLLADGMGYEDLPYRIHGGVTYGPDEDGWIGFDTAHSGDIWPITVIREFRSEEYEDTDYDPCSVARKHRPKWTVEWTWARLVEETESLARQVWGPKALASAVVNRIGRSLCRWARGY